MKRLVLVMLVICVAIAAVTWSLRAQQPSQRIGMVIGIKPDRVSAYEALHAANSKGVRDLLNKYHMHNFSIYIHQLDDGRYYLFGYYEYTGLDYKGDMRKLALEPRNKQWLQMTDPMQAPLRNEKSWSMMQEIYHNP
jgi:L-rhamnose mutarotase